MEQYREILKSLQNDTIKIMQCLSRLLISNSESKGVIEKGIDDYMYELENLCLNSRTYLEAYKSPKDYQQMLYETGKVSDVYGSIEVTFEGWIHISLNTLLPSGKYKISNYLGDTISRLVKEFSGELPYFETAFLAIVEYCNFENHHSLDNDNKGWKMIPNAIKGRVIPDDNQFILSVGLFAKLAENPHSEIYILPPEDAANFMEILANDAL
ncbi:MAG: hypothetical protein KIG65_01120 [Eubacteriales bacterium]|nr:hypothetical protein [Eubacteriales bacterium]